MQSTRTSSDRSPEISCRLQKLEESLKETAERDEQIQALKKQINALQAKIRKEKQLNKQMQMNKELKVLKNELEVLIGDN